MIYRIAIYKDGAFVRYAEPEEIGDIRVNRHGVVEKLSITYRQYTHNNERIPQMQWKDVSDTHKVEWGCILPHIGRVYVNDIIGYADRDSSYNEHVGTFAIDIMYWGYNKGQYATGKVIGDIHENPELLGGDL